MATLTLRPNGDSSVQWPPASNNYANVDEAVADDVDALQLTSFSAAVSGTDRYTFPDHTSESGTINSVKVCARCKKGVVGSPANPSITLISSASGSAQNPTTSYALYTQTWATNPADSAAWEWSDIDALTCGIYGITTYTDKNNYSNLLCSQFYVEVDYTPPSGWANIKNIRPGTGSIIASDIESIWVGTNQIVVTDFDQIGGVTV